MKILLDDEDRYLLENHSWCLTGNGYLCTRIEGKLWLMHQIILPVKKGMTVDHINRDKLDNRRCNLRAATYSQNCQNTGSKGGSSKFKGVTWSKASRKWQAGITVNRKRFHLGVYNTEEEAAVAYNKAALRLYGEGAWTNDVTVLG